MSSERVERFAEHAPVGIEPRCGASFAGYGCACTLPPGHMGEAHSAVFYVDGSPRRIEWIGDYSQRGNQ